MPSDSKLGNDQRNRPDQQKDDPWNQEGTASILRNNPGKTPDIPGSNSNADNRQDHSPSEGKNSVSPFIWTPDGFYQ